MNTIPIGAIPKLWRQKGPNGQEVGSYYVTVAKKPVNLRTKDYMKARERAREAYHEGRRDFIDDRNEPPRLLAAPSTSEPLRFTPPPAASNGAGTFGLADDVSAAASAGFKPDAVFPPKEDPIETKATDANAEYGAPKPKTEDGSSTKISPEMIDGMIGQFAKVLVELQIQGQEYLLARWGHIQAGQVSPVHESRNVVEKLWEQAVREWIPTDLPLPAWLLAPIACAALTIPVQLEKATPLKEEPKGEP